MQYYAQVVDNVVMNVIAGDPTGRFHESIKWVKCKHDTKIGDIFNDTSETFKNPTLSLKEEIELTFMYVNNICQSFMEALLHDYPMYELITWPMQIEEAKILKENKERINEAVFLNAIATRRRINVFLLADKVLEHNVAFRRLTGNIIGKRQYFEDLLKACTSFEYLLNIRQQVQAWQDGGIYA